MDNWVYTLEDIQGDWHRFELLEEVFELLEEVYSITRMDEFSKRKVVNDY